MQVSEGDDLLVGAGGGSDSEAENDEDNEGEEDYDDDEDDAEVADAGSCQLLTVHAANMLPYYFCLDDYIVTHLCPLAPLPALNP